MGINGFLSRRLISGCIYAVDPSSSSKPRKPSSCAKLILLDGTVEIFHRPIPAQDLLSKHPGHQICRSDSFTIGQKIPPLMAGELLKPGSTYFLLPVHLFQSVLSFVALASSFSSFKLLSTSALMKQPFEIHKTASGKLQIRVSEEFLDKMEATQKGGEVFVGRVCSSLALERDYRMLVLDSRERKWRPKLEVIMERKRDVRRQRRKEEKKKKKEQNAQQEQKSKKQKQTKMKKEAGEEGKVKREKKGRSKEKKS